MEADAQPVTRSLTHLFTMPFEIEVNGATVSVERDAIKSLDDGYVLKQQSEIDEIVTRSKAQVKSSLTKAHEEAIAERERTLSEDDEFFTKLATNRGYEIGNDGKLDANVSAERLAEYKSQWAKDELEPVLAEKKKLEESFSTQRTNLFMRDLTSIARDAGLREELIDNPLSPGKPGAVIRDIAESARWNEETESFEFLDEKGEPRLTKDYKPFTPTDIFEHIRSQDKEFRLFTDKRPTRTQVGDKKGRTFTGRAMAKSDFLSLPQSKQHELALLIDKGEFQIIE